MTFSPPTPSRRPPQPAERGGELLLTVVSAALFLYVGFGLGLVGISGDPVYDGSITAFTWGARIVGVGLLLVAALAYFHVPGALLLDFALAALAAAGCLIVRAIWIAFGDLEGVLIVLFGLLNASAARSAWRRWRPDRARLPSEGA